MQAEQTQPEEKLVTRRELEARLQVSKSVIQDWREQKIIPCVRVSAHVILYRWSEVRAALDRRDNSHRSEMREDDEDLLSPAQLAARLKISKGSLLQLRTRRSLPFIRLNRGSIRYRWSEVNALLEAPRKIASEAKPIFSVKPCSFSSRPEWKFRVEGEQNGERVQRFFRTEREAEVFAKKQNSAVGHPSIAPTPDPVRGLPPDAALWRVGPYHAAATPWLKFRVYAKFDGKWKNFFFRTERDAFRRAQELNYELVQVQAGVKPPKPVLTTRPPLMLRSGLSPLPEPDMEADVATPLALETPALTPGASKTRMAKKGPFRVHKTTQEGYKFVARAVVNNKSFRKFFMNEAEAKQYCHVRNIEAGAQGLESITFPSWLRTMADRCQNRLQSFNVSIEDATRYFIEHLERSKQSCSLEQLATAFLSHLQDEGVSRAHYLECRNSFARFNNFAGASTFASEITTETVDAYLSAQVTLNPTSRNCMRTRLHSLFSFAMHRRLCVENPVSGAVLAKQIDSPIEIFTPEQIAAVLQSVEERFMPTVAIGAFAGLRIAEIKRLDWAQVDLEDGYIEVTAANSKTAARRLVKILPCLDAWIRPYAKAEGPVYGFTNFFPGKIFAEATAAAGLTNWPRNGLRHSFASYHISHFKDAAALALEMGHTTTQIIFKHYRQVVRSSAAERYWNIFPPGSIQAQKVVAFSPSLEAKQDNTAATR